MSLSVNIPEELYDQARAIAEAQNIAVEDVFAWALADHFATCSGFVKILIDECVNQRLRFLFSGRDCEMAACAKLSGLKNGALLATAEAAGFDVIVTTDQEIPHQQNLPLRNIAVLVVSAQTNRLADLRPFIPAAIEALDSIKRAR